MRSATRPSEARRHSSPISFKALSQTEPSGTRVASLMVVAARAMGTVPVVTANASRTTAPSAVGGVLVIELSTPQKKIVHLVEQPAGAPLCQDIGQPQRRLGIDVDRQGGLE